MKYIFKSFYSLSLDELYEILKIRNQVFIVEQNCPYQDIDDLDKECFHLLLNEEDKAVAYLRIYLSKKYESFIQVGRVITIARSKGYGLKALNIAFYEAKKLYGDKRFVIEAQKYAKGFYEKAGFYQTSNVFLEDGIEHILMEKD